MSVALLGRPLSHLNITVFQILGEPIPQELCIDL
jgi:hypothetical protein